jgi:hypothetical protein
MTMTATKLQIALRETTVLCEGSGAIGSVVARGSLQLEATLQQLSLTADSSTLNVTAANGAVVVAVLLLDGDSPLSRIVVASYATTIVDSSLLALTSENAAVCGGGAVVRACAVDITDVRTTINGASSLRSTASTLEAGALVAAAGGLAVLTGNANTPALSCNVSISDVTTTLATNSTGNVTVTGANVTAASGGVAVAASGAITIAHIRVDVSDTATVVTCPYDACAASGVSVRQIANAAVAVHDVLLTVRGTSFLVDHFLLAAVVGIVIDTGLSLSIATANVTAAAHNSVIISSFGGRSDIAVVGIRAVANVILSRRVCAVENVSLLLSHSSARIYAIQARPTAAGVTFGLSATVRHVDVSLIDSALSCPALQTSDPVALGGIAMAADPEGVAAVQDVKFTAFGSSVVLGNSGMPAVQAILGVAVLDAIIVDIRLIVVIVNRTSVSVTAQHAVSVGGVLVLQKSTSPTTDISVRDVAAVAVDTHIATTLSGRTAATLGVALTRSSAIGYLGSSGSVLNVTLVVRNVIAFVAQSMFAQALGGITVAYINMVNISDITVLIERSSLRAEGDQFMAVGGVVTGHIKVAGTFNAVVLGGSVRLEAYDSTLTIANGGRGVSVLGYAQSANAGSLVASHLNITAARSNLTVAGADWAAAIAGASLSMQALASTVTVQRFTVVLTDLVAACGSDRVEASTVGGIAGFFPTGDLQLSLASATVTAVNLTAVSTAKYSSAIGGAVLVVRSGSATAAVTDASWQFTDSGTVIARSLRTATVGGIALSVLSAADDVVSPFVIRNATLLAERCRCTIHNARVITVAGDRSSNLCGLTASAFHVATVTARDTELSVSGADTVLISGSETNASSVALAGIAVGSASGVTRVNVTNATMTLSDTRSINVTSRVPSVSIAGISSAEFGGIVRLPGELSEVRVVDLRSTVARVAALFVSFDQAGLAVAGCAHFSEAHGVTTTLSGINTTVESTNVEIRGSGNSTAVGGYVQNALATTTHLSVTAYASSITNSSIVVPVSNAANVVSQLSIGAVLSNGGSTPSVAKFTSAVRSCTFTLSRLLRVAVASVDLSGQTVDEVLDLREMYLRVVKSNVTVPRGTSAVVAGVVVERVTRSPAAYVLVSEVDISVDDSVIDMATTTRGNVGGIVLIQCRLLAMADVRLRAGASNVSLSGTANPRTDVAAISSVVLWLSGGRPMIGAMSITVARGSRLDAAAPDSVITATAGFVMGNGSGALMSQLEVSVTDSLVAASGWGTSCAACVAIGTASDAVDAQTSLASTQLTTSDSTVNASTAGAYGYGIAMSVLVAIYGDQATTTVRDVLIRANTTSGNVTSIGSMFTAASAVLVVQPDSNTPGDTHTVHLRNITIESLAAATVHSVGTADTKRMAAFASAVVLAKANLVLGMADVHIALGSSVFVAAGTASVAVGALFVESREQGTTTQGSISDCVVRLYPRAKVVIDNVLNAVCASGVLWRHNGTATSSSFDSVRDVNITLDTQSSVAVHGAGVSTSAVGVASCLHLFARGAKAVFSQRFHATCTECDISVQQAQHAHVLALAVGTLASSPDIGTIVISSDQMVLAASAATLRVTATESASSVAVVVLTQETTIDLTVLASQLEAQQSTITVSARRAIVVSSFAQTVSASATSMLVRSSFSVRASAVNATAAAVASHAVACSAITYVTAGIVSATWSELQFEVTGASKVTVWTRDHNARAVTAAATNLESNVAATATGVELLIAERSHVTASTATGKVYVSIASIVVVSEASVNPIPMLVIVRDLRIRVLSGSTVDIPAVSGVAAIAGLQLATSYAVDVELQRISFEASRSHLSMTSREGLCLAVLGIAIYPSDSAIQTILIRDVTIAANDIVTVNASVTAGAVGGIFIVGDGAATTIANVLLWLSDSVVTVDGVHISVFGLSVTGPDTFALDNVTIVTLRSEMALHIPWKACVAGISMTDAGKESNLVTRFAVHVVQSSLIGDVVAHLGTHNIASLLFITTFPTTYVISEVSVSAVDTAVDVRVLEQAAVFAVLVRGNENTVQMSNVSIAAVNTSVYAVAETQTSVLAVLMIADAGPASGSFTNVTLYADGCLLSASTSQQFSAVLSIMFHSSTGMALLKNVSALALRSRLHVSGGHTTSAVLAMMPYVTPAINVSLVQFVVCHSSVISEAEVDTSVFDIRGPAGPVAASLSRVSLASNITAAGECASSAPIGGFAGLMVLRQSRWDCARIGYDPRPALLTCPWVDDASWLNGTSALTSASSYFGCVLDAAHNTSGPLGDALEPAQCPLAFPPPALPAMPPPPFVSAARTVTNSISGSWSTTTSLTPDSGSLTLTRCTPTRTPTRTPSPSHSRAGSLSTSRSQPSATRSAAQTVTGLVHSATATPSVRSPSATAPSTFTRFTRFTTSTTSTKSESGRIDHEGNGQPTAPAAVSPVVREAVTTTAATTTAVASVASMGNPTVASQAGRLASLQATLRCRADYADPDSAPPKPDPGGNPLGLALGSGPRANTALHAGAVVGGFVVVSAFAVATLFLAGARYLTTSSHRSANDNGTQRRPLRAAIAWARWPGIVCFAIAYFLQPVVTSSTIGIIYWANNTAAGLIGAVGAVLIVLSFAVVIAQYCWRFRKTFVAVPGEGADDARTIGAWLFNATTEWEELKSSLNSDDPQSSPRHLRSDGKKPKMIALKQYGVAFDPYAAHAPWFFVVELAYNAAGGVAGGVAAGTGCVWSAWLSALVTLVYLAVMVVVRPYARRFDAILQVGLMALQGLAAVLAAVDVTQDVDADTPSEVRDAADWCVLLCAVVATAMGVFEIVKAIHHQLRMRLLKLRRRDGLPEGVDASLLVHMEPVGDDASALFGLDMPPASVAQKHAAADMPEAAPPFLQQISQPPPTGRARKMHMPQAMPARDAGCNIGRDTPSASEQHRVADLFRVRDLDYAEGARPLLDMPLPPSRAAVDSCADSPGGFDEALDAILNAAVPVPDTPPSVARDAAMDEWLDDLL